MYPALSDGNRYLQRRFKRLVDAAFVLRLRSLPSPRYGQQPHVFVLSSTGRRYLKGLGVTVATYFRPAEAHQAAWNDPFMTHRLAAIDVLIAAAGLCRDYPVSCPRLLPERALRRRPVRVRLGNRLVAVIPDGWFQLRAAGGPAYSVALELDRGSEDQTAWRRKVAGYAAWVQGPYQAAFATDNLTIAVVAPTPARRDQLRHWTRAHLARQDALHLAELFLLTAASPVTTGPHGFFFDKLWYLPHREGPVSVLDPPRGAAVSGEVFRVPR